MTMKPGVTTFVFDPCTYPEPFVPPVVVEVEYEHKGERFHQYRMLNIKKQTGGHFDYLTCSGNTEREAEEWMHCTLAMHYGIQGYSIKVISRTEWKGVNDGTACHDAPSK